MTLESALTQIQKIYAFFEQLDVSSGFLIGVACLFALAGLFAFREAAAWFFKVEDVKRDLSRLHDIAIQLEAEVRATRALLQPHMAEPKLEVTDIDAQAGPASVAAPAKSQAPSFPFSH